MLGLSIGDLNCFIEKIVWVFIPGLIGFLSVVITGFAFVSGTISLKATDEIYKANKIEYLISIFFTFYFLGVIVGIDIVYFLALLMAVMSEFAVNNILLYFLTFLGFYINLFIVFYTIGLFDTCMKIFLLNYIYSKEDKKN